MDLDAYRHRSSTTIDRPPGAVYDLLADVSRMGRWSPVCTGGSGMPETLANLKREAESTRSDTP